MFQGDATSGQGDNPVVSKQCKDRLRYKHATWHVWLRLHTTLPACVGGSICRQDHSQGGSSAVPQSVSVVQLEISIGTVVLYSEVVAYEICRQNQGGETDERL